MLRIAQELVVWWPIKVKVPKGDGSGKTDVFKAEVKYRLMKRSDARRLKDMEADEIDALLSEHVLDWKGFADEDGNDLSYSREALEAVRDIPYIDQAITLGLFEASNGAASKN